MNFGKITQEVTPQTQSAETQNEKSKRKTVFSRRRFMSLRLTRK